MPPFSSLQKHTICIAPMMRYTDKHFRYLMRLLSKHVFLYTEMIPTGAIINRNNVQFLSFNDIEHPLAIQLGGNQPKQLAHCAQIAEDIGYDEININAGCPSSKVQDGQFGACLMKTPELVADCISTIAAKVAIPVTVKTRIGIDNDDSYEFLRNFISIVSQANCQTFIIHARKAILTGLNPKKNRTIPALNYDMVYQLKRDFPNINIVINGGITDLAQATEHLSFVDGTMIGRAAYQNPYLLADADRYFFGCQYEQPSRGEILLQFGEYLEEQSQQGIRLQYLARHTAGLFHGQKNARQYRQILSLKDFSDVIKLYLSNNELATNH